MVRAGPRSSPAVCAVLDADSPCFLLSPVPSQRRDWDLTAQSSEVLVPIRLDIDLENIKYRDVLTWNLNGTS